MNDAPKVQIFDRWFLYFFLYSLLVTSVTKLLLIPHFLPWLLDPATHMTVGSDAIYFHNLAVNQMMQMKAHGFSAWTLRPNGESPAGIDSVIYYFFGTGPWVLLPFNSILHALAARLLAETFVRAGVARRVAILCAIPFLVLPISLIWTSQTHKDLFVIPGLFGFFLGLMGMLKKDQTWRQWAWQGVGFELAVCLLWVGRPYLLYIVNFMTFAVLAVLGIYQLVRYRPKTPILITHFAVAVLLLSTNFFYYRSANKYEIGGVSVGDLGIDRNGVVVDVDAEHTWLPSRFLPEKIDRFFDIIAQRRASYLRSYPHGRSNYDKDLVQRTAGDVLAYVPRALWITLTEPSLPSVLAKRFGTNSYALQILGALEMLILDLMLLLGLLAMLRHHRNKLTPTLHIEILYPLLISLFIMVIFGVLSANVGTLTRTRYAELSFFCAASLAYALVSRKRLQARNPAATFGPATLCHSPS